jgi:hypothetical protein
MCGRKLRACFDPFPSVVFWERIFPGVGKRGKKVVKSRHREVRTRMRAQWGCVTPGCAWSAAPMPAAACAWGGMRAQRPGWAADGGGVRGRAAGVRYAPDAGGARWTVCGADAHTAGMHHATHAPRGCRYASRRRRALQRGCAHCGDALRPRCAGYTCKIEWELLLLREILIFNASLSSLEQGLIVGLRDAMRGGGSGGAGAACAQYAFITQGSHDGSCGVATTTSGDMRLAAS